MNKTKWKPWKGKPGDTGPKGLQVLGFHGWIKSRMVGIPVAEWQLHDLDYRIPDTPPVRRKPKARVELPE